MDKADGGTEVCIAGKFLGQKCEDLSDYFFAGASSSYPYLNKYNAEISDHTHPYTYNTYSHSTREVYGAFAGTNVLYSSSSSTRTGTTGTVSGTSHGNNHWPKHMRVIYLFKCF